MKIYDDVPAFVLAGGKSARMGEDKALLDLNGKPLIEWVIRRPKQLFRSVSIVADNKDAYTFLKLPVIQDIIKESGPLGGIHAAFVKSTAKHIFVISCDLPFVTAKLIETLVDKRFEADVVMPADQNSTQPLCAVYSRAAFPFIVKNLREKQYSVSRCLDEMKVTTIYIGKSTNKNGFSIIRNINTPDEYARIQLLKD